VTLTVNGLPAPLFYAGPNQVNFQIPFEVPLGTAQASLSLGGAPLGSEVMAVKKTAPGIFLLAGGHAAARNLDQSVNSPAQPAAPGSAISVYLTGLGPVDPPVATGAAAPINQLSNVTSSVTATIAGQPATVLFAGLAPGYAGLCQVNIAIPQMAPGEYALQIFAASVASNSATISIR
jgi:uncharacterized protein (TIGR03437 family)